VVAIPAESGASIEKTGCSVARLGDHHCTLPGQTIGAIIRLKYIPDARSFKLFVGFVLLYLGGKLIQDLLKRRANNSSGETAPGTAKSRSRVQPEPHLL